MDKELIYEFCLMSTIPGIRKLDSRQSLDEIIDVVIKRANLDALSGARFWDKNYSTNNKYYKEILSRFIIDNKSSLSSYSLLQHMIDNNSKKAYLGSLQKLVNMTLKYLYTLQECGYLDGKGIDIDIKKCDCPLDSVILKRVNKLSNRHFTSWVKINSIEEYEDIQELIDTQTNTRLGFDFENWEAPY